jgi:hypothetical protein
MRRNVAALVMILVLASLFVTSCRRKASSPEAIAEQKAINAQWAIFIKAIDDKDIDGFVSICSKSVLEKRSREKLEEILNNSRKSRMGRAPEDYNIIKYALNKDMTEATVTLINRQKWEFIKENGKWLLKNL